MIRVGIFGAASLTASELITLLLDHPDVTITILTSDTFQGQKLEASFHGRFKNLLNLQFEKYQKDKVLNKCDIVFLSKPHLAHSSVAEELLEKGVKVIDLSADFRIKNAAEFEKWYKPSKDDGYLFSKSYYDLLANAVYGLPEIYASEIACANLIANPGCYPTTVILGLAPLMKADYVLCDTVIVDSYSGVSGAGKSRLKETQFIDLNDNIKPYKFGIHVHTPEMEQELSTLRGSNCKVLFTPHVMPVDVGIISTIYVKLKVPKTEEELFTLYGNFYKDKKFVRIYEPGVLPQLKNVVHTNFCDIGVTFDKRTEWCIITSVIDNLIKGAVGQAVQNMNLMFGLDEAAGLPFGITLKKNEAEFISTKL